MRAFVTGGTGFVGANLVAGLNERGIPARVLRRETSSLEALAGLEYESAIGNILDPPEKLAEAMAGCEWVFHTAAASDYWRQKPEKVYEANVEGTQRVLKGARLAGARRFVFTSSLAAMGLPRGGQPLDESAAFNLPPDRFPYGYSKHLAEIEVQKAVGAGLQAVIVNPSIVLGPRDVKMISGSIIIEAARGLARVYPPGGVNYVAVEDVVAGHIGAAQRGRVGERYILAGENLSHKEALAIVCEIVGRTPPKRPIPSWVLSPLAAVVGGARRVLGNRLPFDANQVRMSGETIYADGSKAAREFNIQMTPFRIAVQNTYDWYNENGFLT